VAAAQHALQLTGARSKEVIVVSAYHDLLIAACNPHIEPTARS
jgi:hypothetical protein